MDKIVLDASRREIIGKHVKNLRKEGKLPAVLYGKGVESTPIYLNAKEVSRALSNVGSSTLVTVKVDGKKYSVLVRERQKDVLSRALLHVDFQAVSLTEKVRAKVRIILEGEAPAAKEYGAFIETGLEELEIECLPTDLVDQFTVDISSLENIGDSILLKDITIPKNIELLEDVNAMIVLATPPAPVAEEEVEEEEVLEEGAEPEVIEKGKEEEETEE
ncbi:MAG: 50S ribosomal protein L25 [Anaerolineales bacterium]|nr:50S ribosomal protein L25 [Anaerolineales bacterium]HEY61043.1 50S ribosomal protein L25 [Anaerolineae bacterium]